MKFDVLGMAELNVHWCRNIPYQDTLRDVTGYRHCRFVVKSLTQTAIDSIVDSLVLLFVVDFSLRKISFQLL